MSNRVVRVMLVALVLSGWGSRLSAQGTVTHPFPGITYITRTESLPSFRCPGCPAPTPSPRLARMNIVLVDLDSARDPLQAHPSRYESSGAQFPRAGLAAAAAAVRMDRQATLAFLEDVARASRDQQPLLRPVSGPRWLAQDPSGT